MGVLDSEGGIDSEGVVEGLAPKDKLADGELVPDAIGDAEDDVEGDSPTDSEADGVRLREPEGV